MIRVGIGGWNFEPWRKTFFPPGLPQAKELAYASRHVTAIEVNGTFYRTQTPESFRRWRDETPDDFVFSLKGPRYVVNRRVLGEAGESIARFLESGITELGPKLGPLLWQFAPTKKFDPDDFAAFLQALPDSQDGHALRHALEVRHPSFGDPAFIELARKHRAAIVYADSHKYPAIADPIADFTYARLLEAHEEEPTGYPPVELDAWAERARVWESGKVPADLTQVSEGAAEKQSGGRDVFIFMINGAKVRAPHAARGLLSALGIALPEAEAAS
ncbi:Uncharacterized conserved protein YecE, DUF72 family [Faunimonas pinastri]|uniref:Uncharacterized conserved protein YecE, DUF72 family n=1 Tax=Faunimonas pinastri TaxID=1855383 RepID=A0A1H9AXU6_9HYPH|nr:DUF72 domain-containing protein [Faunimonas pinastri]SEP81345.1 Uncharacterized conserved protein YecE, DUF72 family [Faunimonas pinastri]